MALRHEDVACDTLSEWYSMYGARLRRFVGWRVRDASLRDEVVQEVFLRAYQSADHFDHGRAAWPWLATIAANVCADVARRARVVREEPYAEPSEPRPLFAPEPFDCVQGSARREAIFSTLKSLAPRQRRVLVLREIEGMRYADLAEQEGLSEDAVKSLLKRARITFRERYTALADRQGLWAAFGPVAALVRTMRRAGGRLSTRIAALADRSETANSIVAVSAGALMTVAAASALIVGQGHRGPVASGGAGVAEVRLPAVQAAPQSNPQVAQSNASHIAKVGAAAVPDRKPLVAASNSIDATGPRLDQRDRIEFSIAGHVVYVDSGLNTSCDFNAVRQAVCDLVESVQ